MGGQGPCQDRGAADPHVPARQRVRGMAPDTGWGRGRELSHLDSKLPQITGEAPEAIARAVGHTQERPVTERETERWRET